MEYLIIKWLHIISATLLFGTGLGSAFYRYLADRDKDIHTIYVTNKNVVIADWIFTTPTVILQPVTGIAMLFYSQYTITEPWVMVSLCLFILAGLCWLPVVYLQIRLRDIAFEALQAGSDLPDKYYRFARIWFLLGIPAFISVMCVFLLMVIKPGWG